MRIVLDLAFITPTALWGWLSFLLLAVVVVIPYLQRNTAAPSSTPATAPRSYLSALAAHYWLAPAVLIISFLHAWIPMASGRMPHTSMRGLWLATYGLGLIFVQLLLGLALRYTRLRAAQALRRVHFVLMLGITGLVLAHLWLNGRFFDLL